MTCFSGLIEALRAEFQQYGEMLARFDDQGTLLALSAPEEVLARLEALEDQEKAVGMAVGRREQIQRRLARRLSLPEAADLADILPLLPPQHQLVMRALMDENKELSVRVQQCAELKRQFLRRSLYLMEGRLLTA